ncbi:MAG: Zn-ribbon domain-containing OB-fold protein [Ktedonobacteraceae bacterium]
MPAQIPIDSDGDSRMYWEGIARGELRIQRCDACSRPVFYPRSLCPHCFSDQLSWIVVTGKGTIYAYTVIHQAFGTFAGDVPFVVAIVELEEGVRVMTRIIGGPRERVMIGAPVCVTFESAAENITLPYFRLVEP